MTRTEAGRIFSPCHSIDILLYIADHPGCKKVDIYRDVSRNTSTISWIWTLAEAGLIEVNDCGRVTFLTATAKGERVAELLRKVETELTDGCPNRK